MEILTRVVLGLFAAALFGGFPALMFAVLTWKVVRSRRESVWVAPKTGRRWTLKEHPERYRFYITFHTILAVVVGLITCGVMIVSFVACVLTPIKTSSVEKPTDLVPTTVSNEPAPATAQTVKETAINATAPAVSKASEDRERIQGTWDYVTLTTGPRDSIVFSQDKIKFYVRDHTVAGTFVLDSRTQPKRIDLLFAGEPNGPDSRQGIYQFQNDLLVICLGITAGFRPMEFQTGEQQTHILLVRPTADSKQGTAP